MHVREGSVSAQPLHNITSAQKYRMAHISKFPSGVILTPSASAETLIVNGWFAETEAMWPGQKLCIQVEEVLLNGRSDFQDILVFKSKTYGTVLVLGKH